MSGQPEAPLMPAAVRVPHANSLPGQGEGEG
jgi:hypothetical protein